LKLEQIPFHPIFPSIFAVLALYVNNFGQVSPSVVIRPLLVSLLLSFGIWGILRLAMKSWSKSALSTTFVMILFFSYGQIRNLLLTSAMPILGKHSILGTIWIVLAILGVFLIIRNVSWLGVLNRVTNLMMISALGIVCIQIGWHALRTSQANQFVAQNNELLSLSLSDPAHSPDIYYIILDTYGRDDVLKKTFNYDNTQFINDLKNLGFEVPECSKANYPYTVLSLASSLNFSYLSDTNLPADFLSNSTQDWDPGGDHPYYQQLIKGNAVLKNLVRLGYKSVAIETPWDWLNITNSSTYLQPTAGYFFNQFELFLIKTTAGQLFWDGIQKWMPEYYFTTMANRQLFIIDSLSKSIHLPGPKFVFVHIAIPHPPYVFATNGDDPIHNRNFWGNNDQPVNEKWYMQGYRNNIDYINSRIIPILSQVIKESGNPPIIIVQGDHGPVGADTRMPILNAYLLPGIGESKIYSSITPVNTFRIIFDTYFGGALNLLEDQSFIYKDLKKPFDFSLYTDNWTRCIEN
jgi:hypothetical protein